MLRAAPDAAREISPSGRTMLELARAKGIAEIVVVLLHQRAPGSESFEGHRELLEESLREVSQNWLLAGWYEGLELIVWSLVVGDRSSYSLGEGWTLEFSGDEVVEWLFLAEAAQGWPTFDGFMQLDDWKKHYASRGPC